MGLHRQRVLIIDDNMEEVELLGVALENMGFDPEIIIDPNLAEDILAERSMQAIIIDLDNAKMEPYRWVKKFADENPGRPVVGMTGKTLKQMAPRLARYGGRAVIRKPIDAERVVEEIEKAFAPPAPRRVRTRPATKRTAKVRTRVNSERKRAAVGRKEKPVKRAATVGKKKKTKAATGKSR